MYFRTVQHRELVQNATCHCFTFGVWNVYQKMYILFPFWNIFQNFIWTFLSRDIANIPRSHVYEYILERGGGWNPDLEKPYLLKYNESKDETFTQGTTTISICLVKFSVSNPSPISCYSERSIMTKFDLLRFLGMKP